MLLKILLCYSFTRLVAIALGLDRILLLCRTRVAAAGILSLIARQWRGTRDGVTIPTIPSASMLFPVVAPMLAPARGNIQTPAAKIGWSVTVVAHRNAQHEQWDVLRFDQIPRPIVPGARIPVVVRVDPIQAVVKEVIRTRSRVIVDRIARYRDQPRVCRHAEADAYTVRPYADAYLSVGRDCRVKQHRNRNNQVTHAPSSDLPFRHGGLSSGRIWACQHSSCRQLDIDGDQILGLSARDNGVRCRTEAGGRCVGCVAFEAFPSPAKAGEGADCRRRERLRTAELARRASARMARVRRMGRS